MTAEVNENTFNQMRSTYNGAKSNPNPVWKNIKSHNIRSKDNISKKHTGKFRDGTTLYESAI
jgi:hypothetical protein